MSQKPNSVLDAVKVSGLPSGSMAESFRDKLSKLTETHLFWSGGIAMIFVAISLAPEHRTFSIICLVIAWLILTISIYKHGFFERRAKWAQFVCNALASLFIAGILALVWFALLPESATTPNPDEAGPSWFRQHVSVGWNYFKYAATWLLPYATGFVIALLLINAKRFFSKFNVRSQSGVREQIPPLLDFAELIRNFAGRPVNMICDMVGPVEVGQSDPSRSKSDHGSSALVAEFVNDVNPDRPSKSVSGVYARIDYETAQRSNPIGIHKGCWIGKRINYASFNVGDARSLILAQESSDGTMYALDNNWQASNSLAEPTRVPLTADEYLVTVRLYTLPTSLGYGDGL